MRFPEDVIDTVMERAGGRCEARLPGCTVVPVDMQHRRARGMGGSRRPHTQCACNALAVCRSYHTRIERRGTDGNDLFFGYWISLHETEPWTVPAWDPDLAEWMWLHCDGTRTVAGDLVRLDLEDRHDDLERNAS